MEGMEGHGGFSPIWNPEFFGNCIMVNGNTWPTLSVERRRYRFRFLNGCQSRFLILDFSNVPGVEVWQIGNEGGFLAAPVNITAGFRNRLLMTLAERADVIVDFTNVPTGAYVLGNLGPDEPFGGGVPGVDFPTADALTTGQVMQFVVGPAVGPDPTTPPAFLGLPPIAPLPLETRVRPLALIEKMGMGVDAEGMAVEGPTEAVLGRVVMNEAVADPWMDAVTENPMPGDTEVWEFFNTTGDAHPMHVHDVMFEVVNREGLVLDENGDPVVPFQLDGFVTLPEPWETGFKDTVIAYPGQVTRIRAQFANPGQFVWHCHIVEHEDNEMMRPFRVGPMQPGQPMPPAHHG
jgi:spore coat protein A, manganese oxidase